MNRTHRFQRKALRVEEAQKRILSRITTMNTEEIALVDSIGRRLADPIYATNDVPAFPRAGMDGYAIRCEGIEKATPAEPLTYRIVGDIAAGSAPAMKLNKGEAVRIMTGASVPEGANAVIMFEQTQQYEQNEQAFVQVKHNVGQGQNIAQVGEEIQEGQAIIEPGRIIQPGQMALLSTFGYHRVKVFVPPKVGIFATGTELLPIEQPLLPGKIRNSNSYMVQALVEASGAIPCLYGIIPDDKERAKALLIEALQEMDIVITTGGVSVGDYDIMAEIFREQSEDMLFNRVSMRPGSPTSAAVIHNKLLFGLSGNPGACFVGFELFVKPAIRAMLGAKEALPTVMEAFLDTDYDKGSPHVRYERGKLWIEKGIVKVKSIGVTKSSHMLSIQDANCLLKIPSGKAGAAKGDLIQVIPLQYDVT
ncbi:gephyrin-like molybdotransferase Glp [Brevibacillus laterosporus]|uniref:Molybdopterin molybdenumtransferase n=1 Tax=Brevibacillus laterosporus TaxID=1465 RepID=A0AAP3G6U2_BRELA|nr:gephyrin-like molybdotransferase Glp [Brevibacillus laterosporus]MCR8978345.1 molybdopterin molybdotransferase MoeA [Brevibacillus laterosporus]MCZ0805501.1 molybdopterin molybdotransferase MoeA [Brevibacillus laterosporus]MCZ0825823.1 molybdopterin molybdotransferase MoeA [Brevibacillus laterosporus]MCZ0850107.1 molybdopterin molybdotransferase MoeA [Brevibacillus laterosporus]